MRALLLVALLLAPMGAAQLTWQDTPDGSVGGVLPLIVVGAEGHIPAYAVDDTTAQKGDTQWFIDLGCTTECRYEAYLDTTKYADGSHTVTVVDMAKDAIHETRTIEFDNSETVHRVWLIKDQYNPWPAALPGEGKIRLLFWISNFGNVDDQLTVTITTPGWTDVQMRLVRENIVVPGTSATWNMAAASSMQINLEANVPPSGSAGGPLSVVLQGTDSQQSINHEFGGWVTSETSGTPAPGALGLLVVAAAALLARRK